MLTYRRLGELLVSQRIITHEQLNNATSEQRKNGKSMLDVLTESGILSNDALFKLLQKETNLEYLDLTQEKISPNISKLIPENIARKYTIVQVKVLKDELILAVYDPLNFEAIENIRTLTQMRITPVLASRQAILWSIDKLYSNEKTVSAVNELLLDKNGEHIDIPDTNPDAPMIRLVNSLIERAVNSRASDIHIEPLENKIIVRIRVDGMLRNIDELPKELQRRISSRVKIFGGMDVTEHRIPLDGRANIIVDDRNIDLRISTLPTIYGEKLAIRILDKDSSILSKDMLGMEPEELNEYSRLLKSSSGVILIVGPTGSGKSSTMYTMITELNTSQQNLVTLEDPVEYNIYGVNQVQINEKTGLTFANGLRAIMRQDPDIICIGEIRDGETAKIAMRAAITGHLVLSTVHTNDAVSSIDRLLDIGVEPYMISAGLKGIIAQRLVRRICTSCKEEYRPSYEELVDAGFDPSARDQHFYRGTGCSKCSGTGYSGRIGVFEILTVDKELRRILNDPQKRDNLNFYSEHKTFRSLRENCKRLVLNGTTSISEFMRTISSLD